MGEFRNLREMSEKERGGKGEAPVPGAARAFPQAICAGLCSQGKSPCCLWSSVGKHSAPYVLFQPLLTAASGLTEQPLLISELCFHSWTDHPLAGKLCSEGKQREFLSLLFCLLLLVAAAEFKVMPGALVSQGTQRRCCRETLCAAVRAPLFSASWYQEKH